MGDNHSIYISLVSFNKLILDGVHFSLKFLGVGSYSSDTRGPFLMKLWGCIELTLTFCIVDFFTSGRMSKPEVGFPHTISVLFRYEIVPGDKENDLESNELCTNISRTGNTGKNRFFVIFTL